MNDEMMRRVKTMLKLRKAGNLSQWTPQNDAALSEEYAYVLGPLPDYAGLWLTKNISVRWQWRPDPCELLEAVVARFAVKHPPAKTSFATLVALRGLIGPYGVPRPGCPGVFDPGSPPLSPLESELIADRGGWERFCYSDTPYSIERAQYIKDYDAILERAAAEGRPTYYLPTQAAPAPAPLLPVAAVKAMQTLESSAKLLTGGEPVDN